MKKTHKVSDYGAKADLWFHSKNSFLSVKEATSLINQEGVDISYGTVRKLIIDGSLKGQRIGQRIFTTRAAIAAMLAGTIPEEENDQVSPRWDELDQYQRGVVNQVICTIASGGAA